MKNVIDLQDDCGAPGNGLSADAALTLAYSKVNEGISNIININGRHAILKHRPNIDFRLASSGLTLQGNGSRSVILPQHPGPYEFAFRYGNLQTFNCRDLHFDTASQGTKVDCGPLLMLGFCPHAVFTNSHFNGLSGYVKSHLGLLYFVHSNTILDRCTFNGCGVGGQAAVITAENWVGFHASHVKFLDFGRSDGLADQWVSKTPWAGSRAWISFAGKMAYRNDDSTVRQGMQAGHVPVIEHCAFDEGVSTAISFTPDPTGPHARGLKVSGCTINVNGTGIFAQHADYLLVEDTFFAWSATASKAVVTKDVRSVRLVRCRAVNGSKIVEATGNLEGVVLEDCEGFTDLRIPKDKLTIIRNGRIVCA